MSPASKDIDVEVTNSTVANELSYCDKEIITPEEEETEILAVDFPFSHMNTACCRRRDTCPLCLRPRTCCFCKFCPSEPLTLPANISVWILQHVNERKRPLSTIRILNRCISGINVILGHKFSKETHPQIPFDENTFVIYPTNDSISHENIPIGNSNVTNLLFVDGTWSEAKRIVKSSPDLATLHHVHINSPNTSAFIIRSQPRKMCLSTLEAVAEVLAVVWNPDVKASLLSPLRSICKFQIEHGAVQHQSHEERIIEGTYDRPISKKRLRYLTGRKFANESEK